MGDFATFTIKNLGPIRSGSFQLRPLTIFIGPNNSGKTYAALAAYALCKGFAAGIEPHYAPTIFPDAINVLERENVPSFSVKVEDLSDEEFDWLQRVLMHANDSAKTNLLEAYRTTFGFDSFDQVVRDRLPRRKMHLSVSEPGSKSSFLDLGHGRAMLHVQLRMPDWRGFSFTARPTTYLRVIHDHTDTKESLITPLAGTELWSAFVGRSKLPHGGAYYLPAGRSGVLASWPLLTSLAVQRAAQPAGAFANLPLPGTVADLLSATLIAGFSPRRVRGDRPNALDDVLEFLEDRILGGAIERDAQGRNQLNYHFRDLRVPVERASSMVAELAPLDLWARELLRPGDLLIFEEPEAHLHPENQRRIAKVLVRLAAAGITVLAPTHSATIVHEVSNIVRAGSLGESARAELGLNEADRIASGDVGVYTFEPGKDGVTIEEAVFDPEFGFPEDRFFDVAEAITDETYTIDSLLNPAVA